MGTHGLDLQSRFARISKKVAASGLKADSVDSMKSDKIAAVIGCAIVGTMLVGMGVALYFAGHRAGRGSACFDIAVATRDHEGRTLRTTLLSRPRVRSDYTFPLVSRR